MSEKAMRFEVYSTTYRTGSRSPLKAIPGFTDGKSYPIYKESIPNDQSYLRGLDYSTVDDNGDKRVVNSNYFFQEAVDFLDPGTRGFTGEYCGVGIDLNFFNQQPSKPKKQVKSVSLDMGEEEISEEVKKSQDMFDRLINQRKTVTLQEKIYDTYRDSFLEMKILSGLICIEDKDPFKLIEKNLDEMQAKAELLTKSALDLTQKVTEIKYALDLIKKASVSV